MNYYLRSLGCPKNEVDASCMGTLLENDGEFHFVDDPAQAEFLIVNTCGFIDDAKKEAIEHILELADVKAARRQTGKPAWLLVTGCLSQRYAKEIYESLPEVDSVLGTAEYAQVAQRLHQLATGAPCRTLPQGRGSLVHLDVAHLPARDRSFAWLKIAEGCSNGCAFCAIPSIRGPLQSRPRKELLREAARLAAAGYREEILIAQDTTRYGRDLYGKNSLRELLTDLIPIPGIDWLRLMYVYGDAFDDELIELMAREKKILHYLDLPIQHASDRILRAMHRRETAEQLRTLIGRLRAAMPDLILRTTVMVGFPGETEEDFAILRDFLAEIRFDRLGAFVFSPEEGTLAAKMPNPVDPQLAWQRYEQVMQLQQTISAEKNAARAGKNCDILIEGISEDGLAYLGRSYGEAPDVDPQILVYAERPDLQIGQIVPCRLLSATAYQLSAVYPAESAEE